MKKLYISLVMVTLLTGCGKESDFKSAINKSIENNYSCLYLRSSTFTSSIGLSNEILQKYVKENTNVIIETVKNGQPVKLNEDALKAKNRADALVKIGFLTKTTKNEPGIDIWNHKPIKDTSFIINLYNLTDKGKKLAKQEHIPSLFSLDNDYQYEYCYTHRQVDNILNYTEQDMNGQKVAQVKYSYKYVDIADWVNNSDIKSAFPEIEDNLNNPNKEAISILIKTNNGWQSHL